MNFVGRKQLKTRLTQLLSESDQAQFICVYGRRRIGKTTLIEEAYKDKTHFIPLEGIEGGSKKSQIELQLKLFTEATGASSSKKIKTWEEFFDFIIDHLSDEKTVLFLDEFQWMAQMRPELVSILKLYWDRKLKKKKNLILIVCGSVSSFIVKKVIKSKALYGRVTQEIELDPLTLSEIKEFFKGSLIEKDFLKYAMCFGGIPEYLHRVDKNKSFNDNLAALAFSPQSYFVKEFQRIFISHFGKHTIYEKVFHSLPIRGASAQELAEELELQTGGRLTEVLQNMVLAGLISKEISMDLKSNSKFSIYKVSDPYLIFYRTILEKYKAEIKSGSLGGFDLINNKVMAQWYGYAFERLCIKNTKLLAELLGFSGVTYQAGPWFRVIKGKKIQIDLLFRRADKVIVLCELKHQEVLKTNSIREQFERNYQYAQDYFPGYSIQRVLVTTSNEISPALKSIFHQIINLQNIA